MRDQQTWLADGQACLEAALSYLARGWSAIPLCPPDHVGVGKAHSAECGSPGKAPLVGWTEFQQRLATEAEARGWWRRWPNANVGIVMGSVSRLVAIDLDGDGAGPSLQLAVGDAIPPAREFTTPGGGRRLIYEIPAGLVLFPTFENNGVKQEVRFLGEGTQTVAPPSRHKTGGYYLWSPTRG